LWMQASWGQGAAGSSAGGALTLFVIRIAIYLPRLGQ
jgi:uncharacterized membrane protein YtjA (UPF0391 family)